MKIVGIKGCTEAKHLFIGEKKIIDYEAAEEPVECRSDHYQSPRKVHISIFGKGANKETSSVTFTVDSVRIILYDFVRFADTLFR